MKVEAVLDERKIEDKRLDLDEILAKIQKNFKKADIKDNLKILCITAFCNIDIRIGIPDYKTIPEIIPF